MTTITIETEQTDETAAAPVGWEGVLGVEGLATEDGRYLMPGLIAERDLPLTLMAQFANEEGHDGSLAAGKITEIWRVPNPDLGENAVEIWGRGQFDVGESGSEAARLVNAQVLRGVSLDMGISAAHLLDPDTLEEVNPDSMDMMDLLMGDYVTGIEGTILGATLCAFPAFAEASLRITRDTVVACGYPMSVQRTLLASAGKPLPAAWFSFPEPDRLTPITVTPEGQVYGHLAPWNQCHTAFPGACELAPRSKTNYAHFHTGEIDTDDGPLPVGTMTVGEKGHAPIGLSFTGAVEHYDNTGSVAAFVRARDGQHGIWLSGAIRPGASEDLVRDLRAFAPSGDWRYDRNTRNLELVAALSVPVQGFPVPRHEAAITASGGEEQITALVASYPIEETVVFDRGQQRQLAVLAGRGRRALA